MYLGDIVVITQLEEQEQITAFTDFMDQFCRLAKHVCEATVTAGIGYVCDNLPDIRLSWQGARSAVSYRVIYGNARAINIAEIDPMENADERWEEQEIQKILKRIRMGTREELETEMASVFDTEKRGELAVQMQQTILDDHAFVFCSHLKMSMISKSSVTGLVAHPCDFYEITADLKPAE